MALIRRKGRQERLKQPPDCVLSDSFGLPLITPSPQIGPLDTGALAPQGGNMAYAIHYKAFFDDVMGDLSDFAREQLPYATSRALNDLAMAVGRELEIAAPKYISAPKPSTRKATMVIHSNKREWPNIQTEVRFKDIAHQNEYLAHVIDGEPTYPTRRYRFTMTPRTTQSSVDLIDQYGGIRRRGIKGGRGLGKKIRTRAGRRSRQTKAFFRGTPRQYRGREGFKGIWERYHNSQGELRRLRLVLAWTSDPQLNRERYPVYEIAQRVADARFANMFSKRMKDAMKTAGRKRR